MMEIGFSVRFLSFCFDLLNQSVIRGLSCGREIMLIFPTVTNLDHIMQYDHNYSI